MPTDTTTRTTAVVVSPTLPPSSTRFAPTTTRQPWTASTPTTAKAVTATTLASVRPTDLNHPDHSQHPPATSWQADKNGVSARVRIEPASPIAGQPLRFVLDVSTAKPCCMILVGFGEGSEVAANVTEVCSGTEPLETGASTFEATHAYAAPGAFRATISVAAGDVCRRPHPPVAESDHPTIIEACFAVGPGSAGQAGCTPRLGSR